MAGRARLLLIAAALAPLPLLVAGAWSAEAARGLPKLVVSARDGDLFVGAEQITSTAAYDTEPDWSPDRRRIVFVRQARGARASSLWIVRRDGGGPTRLTDGDEVVTMPAFRGDGRLIAYAASPLAGGSFDIWTVGLDGRPPKQVAAGAAEQVAPRFTRQGTGPYRALDPGELVRA